MQTVRQTLKAAALYFALVFGAGFVLGPIRILWAVPRFGVRMAELMETPIMLVVVIIAARWTAQRFALPPTLSSRLRYGLHCARSSAGCGIHPCAMASGHVAQ